MSFKSPLLTIFKHEWASHGTCYSTLKPSCLPCGSPRGTEAVLYFQRVVELFRQLPTYDWLAQQGITPSETRTHTLSELLNALKEASGVRCMLSCSTVVLIAGPHHEISTVCGPACICVLDLPSIAVVYLARGGLFRFSFLIALWFDTQNCMYYIVVAWLTCSY
jgi:hypothetical protein